MDIINGIGTVFIVIICIILAPIVWLFSHPIALVLLLAIVGGIVAWLWHKDETEREQEKAEYEAAIAADPFVAIPREEVERWNGIRSYKTSEEEWEAARKSIVGQIHQRIANLTVKRDEWAKVDDGMRDYYQRKIDETAKELPWWEDGGIFDKPLSWGEYKYVD